MKMFIALVFCLGLTGSFGLKCSDISGHWQNELGSRMLLRVGDSNRFSGEYYTAVESETGAAAFTSNITGLYSSQNEGSLLAFSVLFNHGSSLTSWVGQCTVCDGKEILYTSYIYRKYAPNYDDKWATIVVNQNTFSRFNDEAENELGTSGTTNYSPVSIRSVVSNRIPGGSEISGKWKANNKEEIDIFGMDGSNLKGKRHSADVIGRKDGNDMFTAVTWISYANKRIRSWTGFIDTASLTVPKVLETAWLEHEFNPSCTDARNAVRFGTQNFTRTAEEDENNLKKSQTFLDKIRKFFSSMF